MSNRRTHFRRQASVDYPKYTPQAYSTQQPPPVQLQPVPGMEADQESDYPGYNSDYITAKPPPVRTIEEINLGALKRLNPEITTILSVAPYAVLYEFSPSPEPGWSKSGIEGSLFICQLSPGELYEDRFQAVILNRRGLENFQAELRQTATSGIEISDPYVIMTTGEDVDLKIYGVFIFSEGEGSSTAHTREANSTLMQNLAIAAGLSRKAAEAAAQSQPHQHRPQQQSPTPLPQNGVLGDLFRRAGLTS